MRVEWIVATILAIAVLGPWARLWLWRRSAPDAARPRTWRMAVLTAAQPACAVLLFLALHPPSLPLAGGTLIVATAGAARTLLASDGARLIALPEAPGLAGAERAPDLGTALRRHPDTRRLRVVGAGLTPRDVEAARGLTVAFDPPPAREGLAWVGAPRRVAPGSRFQVGVQVTGVADARVELVDPAGRVTDSATLDAGGWVLLTGTARAAGPALFLVRLRDGQGRQVEQANASVLVEADARPRLLIMAGAPGPEVKYLRRWAADAGFEVTARMSAGGGVELGDAPVSLDRGTLGRFDVAVIDDRTWAGLGGGRSAVLDAVRGGMGLILRTGGPADGARAQWRALGFGLSGGDGVAPVAVPAVTDAAVARTRSGIATGAAGDMAAADAYLPEISRLAATPGGGDSVVAVRDAGGAALSAWRALGGGRIAVFTGVDSYALTLTGHRELYSDWWSAMLSAVVRPGAGATLDLPAVAWVGERATLCGLTVDGQVLQPNGEVWTIHRDPATGCGGLWPTTAGWYEVRAGEGDAATSATLYVHRREALPGVRAQRDRDATLRLTSTNASGGAAPSGAAERVPGPAWPWWLAWLMVSAGLWGFERSRVGRMTPSPADG